MAYFKGIHTLMWHASIDDLESCESITRSLNELEEVSVQNNNLETLLVNSPVLTRLYCFNNKLTTLDVSGLTALTYLDCSNNLLPSLDVTKNTKLEQLSCSHNRLTSLDLSKNTKLNYAYTYQYVDNELVKISAKEIGVHGMVAGDILKYIPAAIKNTI